MHILVVGLNHRTAPVEIREQYAIAENELKDALFQLRQQKSIFETVIISTCNRTELYVVADQLHTGRYYTKSFLADWFNTDVNTFENYLFIKENEEAIDHLFRVACGLDSVVIGETQILGQVRDSFFTAQGEGVTGTLFNELFKEAVTVAKRAHSETTINDNAVSVSYAAVELAGKIFGRLNDKHVLIIGAGKMGELAGTHLHSRGAKKITVINRTVEKAHELADKFSGQAADFSKINEALSKADIVISSTGSQDYIITAESAKSAIKARKGRPLFIVDIAVPRDVDPSINEAESVFLYDVDDLEGVVQANLEERKQEAEYIESLISEQLVAFSEWMQTLGVVPVISALRQKALSIQGETMKSIDRKLADLSDRERKVISKHMKSIINQLLRDPIQRAKEFSGESQAQKKLDMFVSIFGIEEEVAEQKERQQAAHSDANQKEHVLKEAPSRS